MGLREKLCKNEMVKIWRREGMNWRAWERERGGGWSTRMAWGQRWEVDDDKKG